MPVAIMTWGRPALPLGEPSGLSGGRTERPEARKGGTGAMADPISIDSWKMTEQGQPMVRSSSEGRPPPAGEALIQVAGCGVCHTDLSFLYFGVPVRADLPLTLGHEISGTVVAAGDGVDPALLGQPVLIPAVLPCGDCPLCQADRRRICRATDSPRSRSNTVRTLADSARPRKRGSSLPTELELGL